jgi:hypothetical protein
MVTKQPKKRAIKASAIKKPAKMNRANGMKVSKTLIKENREWLKEMAKR